MSENVCPEHQLNEERFERIERLLDKLSNTIDIKNAALSEDIKKISEDFNKLKEDYIATKNSVFTTVKKLDGVPEAINNLEKTLINLNNSIINNDSKTDSIDKKLSNLKAHVYEDEERSKFDILTFLKSLIPSLITGGIVFAITQAIK